MQQRNIRIDILAEIIEALREVVETFISQDADVDVTWTYSGHRKHGEVSVIDSYLDRDITELFSTKRSFWESDMRTYIDVVCFLC